MVTSILIGFISPIVVIYIVTLLRSDPMHEDVRKYFPNLRDDEDQ